MRYINGNINRIFIMTCIAALAFMQIGQHFSYAQTKENKRGFTAKIPDGLYLFQDIIDPKEPSITPLMIVKDGRIIDPYKMGVRQIEKTLKENLSEKTLTAYIGDEQTGSLKGIKYTVEDLGKPCPPRVRIKGEYEGFPQNYEPQKSLIYARDNEPILKNFMAAKAVFTPAGYNPARRLQMYSISEEEKDEVIRIVKMNSSKAIAHMKKTLKNAFIRIKPMGGLESLLAVDLDGNGHKDFIGIYQFDVDMKDKRIHREAMSCQMLFVLWDSGQFDVLATNWEVLPAFSLCALMDLDQDNVFEIAYQQDIAPFKDYQSPDMKQITIVRRVNGGWEKIFETQRICGSIQ